MNSGGFMNSSAGDGESSHSNETSCRHLTLKQVRSIHVDENLILDGTPVTSVLLVGVVNKVADMEGRCSITIDDGSGDFSATSFTIDADSVDIGQYACLYGNLRPYNDRISMVVVNVVQPVPFDQVLYHEIVALREHLHYTGVKPFGQPKSEKAVAPALFTESQSDLFGDQEQQKIQLIQLLNLDEGVNIDFLTRQMKASYETISELLRELERVGRVWTSGGGNWYLSND